MFKLSSTPLRDCIEIHCSVHHDERGGLTKTWQSPIFRDLGLPTTFQEQFYSTSKRGVVRGLHCQYPPFACGRLVYCAQGEVLDAVVDVRSGSPTYGQHYSTRLSAGVGNMLYVPEGFAHGFCVLSEYAFLVYNATCIYSPESDGGILWNSVDIAWPVVEPLLSARDLALTPLERFVTPFNYGA